MSGVHHQYSCSEDPHVQEAGLYQRWHVGRQFLLGIIGLAATSNRARSPFFISSWSYSYLSGQALSFQSPFP
jgi:hypothetical protein